MVEARGSISANFTLPYFGPEARGAVVLCKVGLIVVVVVRVAGWVRHLCTNRENEKI